MRGPVTGNSDKIFDEHYDLVRISRFKDTLLENLCHHRGSENTSSLQWTKEDEDRRQREKQAIESADMAAMMEEEAVDITTKQRPMAVFNRLKFKKSLEQLNPKLWSMAGKYKYKDD